jgi:Kef-type K+ transport system membrane component KefB
MSLLLLLTGLETDLRLLRNLGRAALIASVMGMVLPFGLGFGLGQYMPEQYLADPNGRMLFSLFLATAMSISAMPVIAKILIDLDLTKRNIGLVILSAGVVDDTVGWLILSLIAAAATHGVVHIQDLGLTVAYLAIFIIATIFVLTRSPLRRPLRDRALQGERLDLVLVIVTAFLCAAATSASACIRVRRSSRASCSARRHLRKETIARLESSRSACWRRSSSASSD